jgi:dephospho-CoA kinase
VKKLGLTGSIATGKSTALKAFAEFGVPVFSSDEAVHDLYDGGAAVAEVEALFPGVIHSGKVDRAKLAARLIAHPERLAALEAAVHPLVRQRLSAFLREAESSGAPLAVVDIPLLFETGFEYGLDEVLVTSVDAETQRRRALGRPGMTEEKLQTMLDRQMPQAEKLRRADRVLDTSGPLEATRAAIGRIIAEVTGRGAPLRQKPAGR